MTDTEETVVGQIRTALGLTTDQLSLVDIRTASQDHGVCQPLNQRWIAQSTGDTSAAGIHPNLSMFALEARAVDNSL
jgi:hypothetical protein